MPLRMASASEAILTAAPRRETRPAVGRKLSRAGARVGIASGRARVNLLGAAGEVLPVGEVVDRASALARDAKPGVVLADVTTS